MNKPVTTSISKKKTLTLILMGEGGNPLISPTAIKFPAGDGGIQCTQVLVLNQLDFTKILNLSETEAVSQSLSIQVFASISELVLHIRSLTTDLIGYLPFRANQSLVVPMLDEINVLTQANIFAPWIPSTQLPLETAQESTIEIEGWIASTHLIQGAISQLKASDNWKILKMAAILEAMDSSINWGAISGRTDSVSAINYVATSFMPQSVLAVIPHYRCEAWLGRCLRSLINQRRPLDGIVVIDDCSEHPPTSIVKEFPSVTLLTSPINVGPYRLIQRVIEQTNYDAYLFQDADDWSTCDRLAKLLRVTHETGAELVGTQELRVMKEQQKLVPVNYPLDVNAALRDKPGHPLLHPTSLVSRNLVMQLGGFATGLRFGGDTEFLLRAVFAAKIINIPDYCYFRQKRDNSLTTSPDTGLQSLARTELLRLIKNRALANTAVVKAGKMPCLSPLATTSPIKLQHRLGPKLYWAQF